MSKPTASQPRSSRRRPVHLGLSGVAAIASIGLFSRCLGELTGGPALGRNGYHSLAGRAAGDPRAPLPPPEVALLGKQQWFNGRLDDPALRGKVVLVNFWTYSCINSLRPLPYLKALAEKYRSRGLVVVGVHTPEFGFEKDPGNVRQALTALGVSYPVVLDSDFGIWRAFGNDGWPGFYLIGPDGRVRHRSLGEANLAKTERSIEQVLAEWDGRRAFGPATAPDAAGVEAAADWANQRSPETYVGYAKAERFASPGGLVRDTAHRYAPSGILPRNRWDLAKTWTVGGEYAEPAGRGGALRYRFHARDLHLVMGLAPGGKPVRFRVTIDGRAPNGDHGVDIGADGEGRLTQSRLYQLVRQSGAIGDRTFEIEFSAPGARVYAFTFG